MSRKEILIVALTIFLTVIAWVVSDIIHAQAKERSNIDMSIPSTEQYDIDESVFTILESRTE